MDIYSLMNLYHRIESPRLKLMGIMMLHVLHRRYLNLAFDPVEACNLRCRMCYFSDPEVRKYLHGRFSDEDIKAIADSLFHRVLRLQIGCGAEPLVYNKLTELVALARKKGIPHISVTTNGNLLTKQKLKELADAGLDELILSAHGMSKEMYEYLMQGAKFDKFLQVLDDIEQLRAGGAKALCVRINYTMNQDNIDDLKLMPKVFERMKPNVIQLRPIQKLSNDTSYQNYSLDSLVERYQEDIAPVIEFCLANNITCLYPEQKHLLTIDESEEAYEHKNSIVNLLPNFYLGPYEGWKEKINPYEETFEDYSRRTGRLRFMLKHILGFHADEETLEVTKSLNYNIK